MRVLRPNLGRKKYTVYRDDGLNGGYIDGEWVESGKVEVTIRSNIQPSFQAYQTSLILQGDREKEAIWFSSIDYVYTSRSNGIKNLSPDYILYNDCLWEVKYTMPYQNLGFHVEGLAIKLPDSERERITGEVYGRK